MSAKTLDNVQAKISGRADLLCMVDCEEDELLKECFAMTNHKFEPPPTVGDIVTGSVIDVRSVSRVGQSDIGVNAARIMKFIDSF